MKYYIGIDLGGTNIKAGVVNEEFEIIAKATCKTNLPRPAEEICEDMAKVALEAVKNAGLEIEQIESVGIGTPGTANSDTGVIEYSNNLGFLNFHVVDLMKKFIDKPCYVENDANAAAYGEDTLPSSSFIFHMIESLSSNIASFVILTRPVAEENTSKQPCLPQVHCGPLGSITV